MSSPYLYAGEPQHKTQIRGESLPPRKMKKPRTKKLQHSQHPQHLQQPRLTDEQWAVEVRDFRVAVQGNHVDAIIQEAWKRLRQAYSNKFSAVVNSTTSLETLEPFPFWASENIETEILERILRVEFAEQLSRANYMPTINNSAIQAKLSIWHLVLFFGQSLFSETRIFLLKKRLRVFVFDPEDGTWPFTQAYKSMLRHAIVASSVPEINTSLIPCAGGPVLFKTPQISGLAPANPEFERNPQKSGTKPKQANGFAMTGIPLSKKSANRASGSLALGLPSVEGHMEDDRAKVQGQRSQPQQQQVTRSSTAPKSLVVVMAQAQVEEETDSQASPKKSSAYRESKESRLPPLRQSTTERSNFWGVDSDFALLSIEGAVEAENTTKSTVTLMDGKHGGVTSLSDCLKETGAQARAKTNKQPLEHLAGLQYIEPEMSVEKTMYTAGEERFVKAESVASASPFSAYHNASSASRKRSITDLGGLDSPCSKRMDTTNNHAHLTERAQDWDDDTILGILKQLEAMRPNDFIVINGMKTYDVQDLSCHIFGTDEEKCAILLPLKTNDGHRLLVVIKLRPIATISENTKQGVIQFYDPEGGAESDGYYEPVSLVAQLIGFVLPDRDPDPDAWDVQHCVCPDQLAEGNSGVCVCLSAICVVGSLPLAPPLPEEVDWMFWRNTILSIFLPEDASLQIRAKHYRAETVERLLREGRVRGLTPAEPSTDDIQYLGHTIRDAHDRIRHRAANTKALIEMIHQGLRIFHNLQENIDLSHAFFRAELDRNLIGRGAKRKISIKAETPEQRSSIDAHTDERLFSVDGHLGQDDASIQLFNARCYKLSAARQHIRKAMQELNQWRSLIRSAVEEHDESARYAMTDCMLT